MNINDVISNARQDFLNDTVEEYLWPTAQLTRFVHEAVIEACKRTPLLKQVFNISVSIGNATYDIDPSVRQIYKAQLALADKPLDMSTDIQLSMFRGHNWRTESNTPTHYIRRNKEITLYAKPIVADTLTFEASVIPILPSDYDFEYDIDPAYQHNIVYYVVYKAFMVRDQDTYNPVKAAEYLGMFNDRFGLPKSAKYDSVSQNSPMYGTIVSGRMA